MMGPDLAYHTDDREMASLTPTSSRQNGGYPDHNNNNNNNNTNNSNMGRPPASPAISAGDRDNDTESRRSGERNRSRPLNNRIVNGQVRLCKKCGEHLTGQFVRALDGTFHLDCFRCRDCGQIVASKFFPADDEHGEQYPFYYEHEGQVYCHYHYSTRFAQRCSGCQTAILKQFVEIFRNGQNQHWHPECYMIHKFWNVRLNPPKEAVDTPEDTPSAREEVRHEEERMEEKVYRIWSVLSAFEESSAACISDMLLHVSNGAYVDGIMVAKKFIWHVDLLFRAADNLDVAMSRMDVKGLSYSREAKLLCKKIVSFFSLLSKTQDKTVRKLGVTQELLTLVTGLAHYLKLLIRICLQGALRIEKERGSPEALHRFLEDLGDLEALKNDDKSTTTLQLTTGYSRLSASDSDNCLACRKPIEDECAKNGDRRWHIACTNCARCKKELGQHLGEARLNLYDNKIFCASECKSYASEKAAPFERVTKLQQYIFLLQVALARLLEILRSSGALPQASEDTPMGNGYDDEGGRQSADRSKAWAGEQLSQHHRESSYESTLNDVRRLRSTRLDKHLSSSFRKARTSRIMDGPEGSSVRPGSSGAEREGKQKGFQIVEERGPPDDGRTDTMLHNQDALTLDDIPRIVAAEQAREQRSYQPPRQELFRSPATEPSYGAGAPGGAGAGHQRSYSDGRGAGPPMAPRGGRKYFSELSGLEYFIVRHLAVLTMHPLVEHEFTLEELLNLIESKKAPTFWKNIGKAFRPNDRPKNTKKKGIFGVPLELVVEKDGAESTDGIGPGALRIPALLDDIVAVMRQMDLSVEGVFRKNGNIRKLNELCERIDREGSVDLSGVNVMLVAALLKRYLRELPDPLLTHKLYRLWLAAAKINDADRKRRCLHLVCCLLPKVHRDALEILFTFLKWTGSFHQVDDEAGSKMDIKNLATVIAPNVLFNNAKSLSLDSDPIYAIEAVETLITYIEEMCMVPEDLVYAMNDPSLFGPNSGDITTKEILKKFGDRTLQSGPQRFGEVVAGSTGDVSSTTVHSGNNGGGAHPPYHHQHHLNPSRPPPRRVETDPGAWQNEATAVRPVMAQDAAFAKVHQATPPKWRGELENGGGMGVPSPFTTPGRGTASAGGGAGTTAPPGVRRGVAYDGPGTAGEGVNGQGPPRREWRDSGWGRQDSGVATGSA
ncbi:hypothetical protein P8C59_003969 [Phyllachora maydis]|uniref:Uncharacterized protein n=1 Tax=Phyllachora maydis TaxID=1825666 RepID=A0AAD9I1A2_9PEZI|nr:hypothetical protein P8C59_003969 [Phyllachora maydis]